LYVSSAGEHAFASGDDINASGPMGPDRKPALAGATPTGWAVSFTYTNGGTRKLVVYAVCARP
jgi:hypothetical protein